MIKQLKNYKMDMYESLHDTVPQAHKRVQQAEARGWV